MWLMKASSNLKSQELNYKKMIIMMTYELSSQNIN